MTNIKLDRLSVIARKFKIDSNGCWIWIAYANKSGYAYVADNGTQQAHRWFYELIKGKIPDGLEIDHLCRVTRCVNPAHLEPVTKLENHRRSHKGNRGNYATNGAINRNKTHCPKGHPYNESNTYYRKDRNGRNCISCAKDTQSKRTEKRRIERMLNNAKSN